MLRTAGRHLLPPLPTQQHPLPIHHPLPTLPQPPPTTSSPSDPHFNSPLKSTTHFARHQQICKSGFSSPLPSSPPNKIVPASTTLANVHTFLLRRLPDKGQECHVPRALDGLRHRAVVPAAQAVLPPGGQRAELADVIVQQLHVFPVDAVVPAGTELAAAGRSLPAAARRLAAAAARSQGGVRAGGAALGKAGRGGGLRTRWCPRRTCGRGRG